MRFTTSLIALSFASVILAIPQDAKEPDDGKYHHLPVHPNPPVLICAPRSQAVPLLRAYNPTITDHFYTTNQQEMDNAVDALSYQPEGPPGSVFPTQVRGAVPLYRGYQPRIFDHFYTTNEQEMNNAVQKLGYSPEGIAGYVYPEAKCGAIPLYRTYNPQITDHFYTSDAAERDNAVNRLGYADEGIAGYILPVED